MASFSELLNGAGESGKQLFLWGVLIGLVQQMTQPYQRDLLFAANDVDPNVPLAPDVLASAVERGWTQADDGAANAKKQGVNNDLFQVLRDLASSPPDTGTLIAALNRGILDWEAETANGPAVKDALRWAGIKESFLPTLKEMATQIPSVAEVMNAWLEGQIEEPEARTRYLAAGGDPSWFQTSYNANGQAPTPSEALELANRGIIPWDGTGPDAVTYQQAFLEGPWRNKWEASFRALGAYLPPPRTVTAMLRAGSLSTEQATSLLEKQGLTADLAAAYVADASNQNTAATKQLAASQITTLYADQAMDAATATPLLEGLGYNAADAAFILEIVDLQRTTAAVTSAMTRIGSLYIARKIDVTAATDALNSLNVPVAQARQLIQTWTLEAGANVKILTESQVVDAWGYHVMTQDEAMDGLEALGYTPYDAWLLLSNKNKAPLPGKPTAGPAPFYSPPAAE